MANWKKFKFIEVEERPSYVQALSAITSTLPDPTALSEWDEWLRSAIPLCTAHDEGVKLLPKMTNGGEPLMERVKIVLGVLEKCVVYTKTFWSTAQPTAPPAPTPQPRSFSESANAMTPERARGVDTGEGESPLHYPTDPTNAASEVTTPLAPLGERGREKGAGSFHLDDIITRLSPTLRSQAESIEAVYALLNDAHETMSRLTYEWWKGQPGYWKAKEVRILHYKHVHSLVEQTVPSPNLPKGEGEKVPFWVLYAKQEEGEPISPADGQVVCISTDKKSGTRRVQFVQSGEIRRLCDSNICRVWLSRDKEWNVVGN